MLHLLNNAGMLEKVKSPKARVSMWIKEDKEMPWIVEHIYLATLSRRPTAKEMGLVSTI